MIYRMSNASEQLVVCVQGISLMKTFAWEVIHRNSIKREIKRLELRIVEMAKTFADKP